MVILDSKLLKLSPQQHLSFHCSHNRQPYLRQPTSRRDHLPNSPSRPLTPIQPFTHNGWNFRNKEPKYNRPQPDHPDPQSVLRTRIRQGNKL